MRAWAVGRWAAPFRAGPGGLRGRGWGAGLGRGVGGRGRGLAGADSRGPGLLAGAPPAERAGPSLPGWPGVAAAGSLVQEGTPHRAPLRPEEGPERSSSFRGVLALFLLRPMGSRVDSGVSVKGDGFL